MKAGWTKIVLAMWLIAWAAAMRFEVDGNAAFWFIAVLGFTALLAYQAGKGDRAWM